MSYDSTLNEDTAKSVLSYIVSENLLENEPFFETHDLGGYTFTPTVAGKFGIGKRYKLVHCYNESYSV